MLSLSRILCPVDFSDASAHAIDHAIAIAQWYEGSITALHVFSPIFLPVRGAAVVSSVSLTANRYESVAAMISCSPSKRTRTPVRTGLDSSRDAARPTLSIVSSSAGASMRWSGMSSGGRRGKSSALKTFTRDEWLPDVMARTPSPSSYVRVTDSSGRSLTRSVRSLPGTTTAASQPGSSEGQRFP